jgi:hypothetical protein
VHHSITHVLKINYMENKRDSEGDSDVVTHTSLLSFINCLIFTRLGINIMTGWHPNIVNLLKTVIIAWWTRYLVSYERS